MMKSLISVLTILVTGYEVFVGEEWGNPYGNGINYFLCKKFSKSISRGGSAPLIPRNPLKRLDRNFLMILLFSQLRKISV